MKGLQFSFRQALVADDESPNLLQHHAGLTVVQRDTEIMIDPAHRMGTRVLAQHQSVAATQLRWINSLIIERMLEQAVNVNPGFMGECAFSDQAFVPGQWPVGGSSNPVGKSQEAGQVNIDLKAVQLAQTHDHFLQRRIAGPLAQAIHGGVDMSSAADGGESVLAVASPRSSWACISSSRSTAARSC